jgi:uncharacterized protein (DUF58 family)
MPSRAKKASPFVRYLHLSYARYNRLARTWRDRLTPAGWTVVVSALLSGVIGLNTNETTAYQLFCFLAAVFCVSASLSLFHRPRLIIRRHVPRVASVGQALRYRFEIDNLNGRSYSHLSFQENLPQPLPSVESFHQVPEPGESDRNPFDRTFLYYRWNWLRQRARIAHSEPTDPVALPAKGRVRVETVLKPLRRGVLTLDSVRVLHPDLFGLIYFIRRHETEVTDKITILPRRYPIPGLNLTGESQYQPCGVALASEIGQSEEFIGLRDYRPGDPIRHLHWRSWARTGHPIVMEFEDEYYPRYALALDTFGSPELSDVFEEAVSVAASFAYTLDSHESLLDLLFVGTKAYVHTSGRGVSQPERLLEILSAVDMTSDGQFSDLHVLLTSRIRDVTACIVILLSWDEERRACIQRLRESGVSLMILLVGRPDPGLEEQVVKEGVHFLSLNQVGEGLASL